MESDRLRKSGHGSQGRIRSQPSHEAKIGVFPERIAAGSGCRNHSARMEAALPRDRGDRVFPSPRTNKPYDSGSLRKKALKAAAVRAEIHGPIGTTSVTLRKLMRSSASLKTPRPPLWKKSCVSRRNQRSVRPAEFLLRAVERHFRCRHPSDFSGQMMTYSISGAEFL